MFSYLLKMYGVLSVVSLFTAKQKIMENMQFIPVVWAWVMVIFRWLFLFSSIEATHIDEQQ